MSYISDIFAREIIDSRGWPTVEVDVILESGSLGRASVPSGASTGTHEVVELRDYDESRFGGKGVLKACQNVNFEIRNKLIGVDAGDQTALDQIIIELDGTKNKGRLGANAILGVSLAAAQAVAKESNIPLYQHIGGKFAYSLPVPLMNIINGGKHADNPISIQEFMIVPVGADNVAHAIRMGSEIFQTLKSDLKSAGHNTNVGDEGGFAPNLKNADEALAYIVKSIKNSGYKPGENVLLALDCASSEYYKDGKYFLPSENKSLDSEANSNYLAELTKRYPIFSIEDGMSEDDWEGWKILTEMIGKTCQLVGDDIFTTNPERLYRGINKNIANSILIKPNQIGTLSETIKTVRIAQSHSYTTIISHRSGETEDTIISDIAVGTGAEQIKTGSLSRSDRLSKYNQLIRIEQELGSNAKYVGKKIMNR